MFKSVLIWCILVPVITSIVILLPTWWPWRRSQIASPSEDGSLVRSSAMRHGWAFVIAVSIGYAISHLGLRNNWAIDFPPSDARQWVLYFLIPMAVLSLMHGARWAQWWMRAAIALVLFGSFFPLFLSPMVANSWSASGRWIWLAGLTVVAALYSLSMGSLARRLGARTWIFPIGLYTAGAAVTFMLLASATTALQAAVPAVFLGLAFLLAWMKREARPFAWASLPISFLIVAFACEVFFYSYAEEPAPPLALLAVAPSLMWLVFLPSVHRRIASHPVWRAILCTILIVLPSLSATYLAYQSNYGQAAEDDPYADYQ